MVSCKNIYKEINENKILNDISLSCIENNIYVLSGSNGVGKTSILRCITGLYKVDKGKVFIDNYDIEQINNICKYKKVGICSSTSSLYKELTVDENINFFSSFNKVDYEQKEKYFKIFDLIDFKNTKFRNLSDGNKKKCMLMLSLINDPELIIWDEPFAFVDVETSYQIIEILKNLKKEGKTIIITSNDLVHVESVYDKIGFLFSSDYFLEFDKNQLLKEFPDKTLEQIYSKLLMEFENK